MDNKTAGIVATVATVLLCGCPGIFVCLFGALSAAGLGTWTGELGLSEYGGRVPTGTGVGLLCLGLLFIAIPVVVGFLTLRKKPQPPVDSVPPVS